jgi:hypothetical protein
MIVHFHLLFQFHFLSTNQPTSQTRSKMVRWSWAATVLSAVTVTTVSGHGAMVSPRSRNSVDYLASVNTQVDSGCDRVVAPNSDITHPLTLHSLTHSLTEPLHSSTVATACSGALTSRGTSATMDKLPSGTPKGGESVVSSHSLVESLTPSHTTLWTARTHARLFLGLSYRLRLLHSPLWHLPGCTAPSRASVTHSLTGCVLGTARVLPH